MEKKIRFGGYYWLKKPTNLIASNIMLLLGENWVRAINVFQNTLPVNSWASYLLFPFLISWEKPQKVCYDQIQERPHTVGVSVYSLLGLKKVPVTTLITNNLFWWLAKQTTKKWQTPIIQLKFHFLNFSGKVEDLVFLSFCSLLLQLDSSVGGK